jgi:8-oxo-dGTP diphosphatase
MPGIFAAKTIVVHEGKTALILRDNDPKISSPNMWDAPGGGIEEEETPDNAVKRELHEEVSVIPGNLRSAEMTTYNDGSVVYRYFAILRVRLGNEGQRLEWFTYDEALRLNLSLHFKPYFERHKNLILETLKNS